MIIKANLKDRTKVRSFFTCKNSNGDLELTVAGEGNPAPTMIVEETIRTGATTYNGGGEGLSLQLSIGGRPTINDGVVSRTGHVRLIIGDIATGATLQCVHM